MSENKLQKQWEQRLALLKMADLICTMRGPAAFQANSAYKYKRDEEYTVGWGIGFSMKHFANGMWADAVLDAYGDCSMGWEYLVDNVIEKCTLGNGEVYINKNEDVYRPDKDFVVKAGLFV